MMTSTLSVLMLPIKYLFLKSAHSSQYNNNTTTPLIIVRHALCYEVKYCAFSRNNNNISIRISIYCHALCSVRVACCALRVALITTKNLGTLKPSEARPSRSETKRNAEQHASRMLVC